MPQIFSRSADTWLRVILLGAVLFIVGGFTVVGAVVRSDWVTGVGDTPAQPVPFSHEHHVGQLGLDCRYCHTTAEVSATAGMPPTETCMTCHSQIWTNAAVLAPVRDSFATGLPLHWARVNSVPDFVYFNHSVHVANGIGCSTCHGPVQRMALTYQAEPLSMSWCLDCHRDPAPYLRPPGAVYDMGWQPAADQEARGHALMVERGIDPARLVDCYTCHR